METEEEVLKQWGRGCPVVSEGVADGPLPTPSQGILAG
jgi:hypothetical protein